MNLSGSKKFNVLYADSKKQTADTDSVITDFEEKNSDFINHYN